MRSALEQAFAAPFEVGLPAEPRADDLVVLGLGGPDAEGDVPLRNPFGACSRLKAQPRIAVFIVIDVADSLGPEIARFCLADGCLQLDADGSLDGVDDVLRRWHRPRERASVDDLLERLERELADDRGRQMSALQRMLDGERDAGFVARLTDRETGLFDGPFASFKLDEEFKRARRFHQPLSLLLLDCGVAEWPRDAEARARCWPRSRRPS
ncbi:MAG: hypothetical protein IPM29_18820 [Planctomycetes bacterium]|nr:hypothetical protein [Planctomycetota bacterium]